MESDRSGARTVHLLPFQNQRVLNTAAGDMSSEADALDVLMEEYEKQAAADCKAVEERYAKKRNAEEQTQVDVLQPLPKHNK